MDVDPYCWPTSSCLKNKLGIHDEDDLRLAEARIVSARDVELQTNTLPGEYNAEHLMMFHHRLFRDVYDWAGQTRTVDIAKGRSRFCHWRHVDEQLVAALNSLASENKLQGLAKDHFVARLAYYYSELNAIHPFREGNGRTQRSFLRQLSASANWRLDWSQVTPEDNDAACEASVTGSEDGLIALLHPAIAHM